MAKVFNILLMALGFVAIIIALFQGYATNIGLQEDAVFLGPLGMIIASGLPIIGTAAVILGYQGLPEKG